jgi:hypothetical protein
MAAASTVCLDEVRGTADAGGFARRVVGGLDYIR